METQTLPEQFRADPLRVRDISNSSFYITVGALLLDINSFLWVDLNAPIFKQFTPENPVKITILDGKITVLITKVISKWKVSEEVTYPSIRYKRVDTIIS